MQDVSIKVRKTTIEQQRITVGGVPIFYQVAGQGLPLVLVHGLSGSGRWWRHNILPLARQFQVYVIDLIGFGRSRGRYPFVLTEAAGYLVAWMDAVGIEQAGIIGHSMGGFITAELAADCPQRISRMVLIAPALMPRELSSLAHAAGLFRVFRHLPPGFLPILFTDALRAGPVTLCKAARELLATDLWPRLQDLATPTLLVWGEHDTLVPLSVAGQLRHCLRDTRLVVIPSAGHNPMWDRPRLFNQTVLPFLSNVMDMPAAGAGPAYPVLTPIPGEP